MQGNPCIRLKLGALERPARDANLPKLGFDIDKFQ